MSENARPPAQVAFLFHPGVDRDDPRLVDARRSLGRRGLSVWEGVTDEHLPRLPEALAESRLLVTFGGDGTLLSGARAAVPASVPVLGVNLGRLGFLAATDIGGLAELLTLAVEGRARTEPRAVIRWSADDQPGGIAINEIALRTAGADRLVRLRAEVDGVPLGTFDADGAIVATSSGSTAYSLSAGGPILEPALRSLVLTPLNAFTLAARSLVLAPDDIVSLWAPDAELRATIDGQETAQLRVGEVVRVTSHEKSLLLVVPDSGDGFYRLLREKIRWGISLIP
ncbi:MAG: NAD(+)/NADH kinase [Candidatus Dormibacteria bacterium]